MLFVHSQQFHTVTCLSPLSFYCQSYFIGNVHPWIIHEPALLFCKQKISQQLEMLAIVFGDEEKPLLL